MHWTVVPLALPSLAVGLKAVPFSGLSLLGRMTSEGVGLGAENWREDKGACVGAGAR